MGQNVSGLRGGGAKQACGRPRGRFLLLCSREGTTDVIEKLAKGTEREVQRPPLVSSKDLRDFPFPTTQAPESRDDGS